VFKGGIDESFGNGRIKLLVGGLLCVFCVLSFLYVLSFFFCGKNYVSKSYFYVPLFRLFVRNITEILQNDGLNVKKWSF